VKERLSEIDPLRKKEKSEKIQIEHKKTLLSEKKKKNCFHGIFLSIIILFQ
jgi:hypothetical protein